jgi:hypothetical protein
MSIEAMKQALEALERAERDGAWSIDTTKAITALRTAIEQAEKQEPVSNGKLNVTLQDTPTEIELARYKRMFEAACSALGDVSEALGCDPNEGGSEPLIAAIERLNSSSREPIAWMVYTLDGKSVFVTDNPTDFTNEHRALPLYTTPPAAQPAPVQEPDEWLTGCPECGMDSGCDCDSGTWNPPAAPVQEHEPENEPFVSLASVQSAERVEPVAQSLKDAVFTVLEGFTLPHDVRKILETAYYTTPPAGEKK